ncbi:hypothetical protein ES288_A04G180600v1 [Gossypium darwinii]|uniref:Uncharacterized protein n=1 Tax=Gossypium darwinii TaxID=34276 RepID=A0A5D2GY06_GOSDA|nr:hypothetical protein ES288_A04G180600v1 [Gossypium darwinii]
MPIWFDILDHSFQVYDPKTFTKLYKKTDPSMETWMEFEIKNHTHTLNQKLNFFNTLKQALMIPYKSPNIIVLCFLVSIPLCFTLLFHEMMLQQTIIAAMDMLREPNAKTMANSFFYKLIQLALLRLLPLHLSELCVAVVTIDSVSRKKKSEMVRRLVDKERWRGILVTSTYVQFVSNGFLLGSTWLMMNYYVIVRSFCYNVFTAAFLRIGGEIFRMDGYMEYEYRDLDVGGGTWSGCSRTLGLSLPRQRKTRVLVDVRILCVENRVTVYMF